jgi:hypothetical protein
MSLDIAAIQRLPCWAQVSGRRITCLDSASSQKPLRCSARWTTASNATTPTSTAAFASPKRPLRPTSSPGARSPAHRRPSTSEVVFVLQAEASPRRLHVGARQPARRRRRRAHTWSTTPTSCRGTSSPRATSSCVDRLTADYQLDLTLPIGCSGARLLAVPRCRTYSARSATSGRWPTPRARRALVLVGACHYVPHVATDVRPGRRLRRILRPQDVRPGGIGARRRRNCSRRCRRSSRRRDDRDVRLDSYSTTTCRGSSKQARNRSPRPSASARPSTTPGAEACRPSRPRDAAHPLHARRVSATASQTHTIYGRSTRRSAGLVPFLFDGIHATSARSSLRT